MLAQAQDWKSKGNEAFGKSLTEEAISAYSQGIVLCDRIILVDEGEDSIATTTRSLKAALLSNRAMCYLKIMKLQLCIDDCTTGLNALNSDEPTLRTKLWYRRAKGRFLLANIGNSNHDNNDLLQEAAKDILNLLQVDPKNSEANKLLMTIRAQHKSQTTSTTPVSKMLNEIRSKKDENAVHSLKVLLGMIDNDTSNASMEIGRLDGPSLLLEIARMPQKTSTTEARKAAFLAMQCIASCGNHPLFVRTYLVQLQDALTDLLGESASSADIAVSVMSIFVRILLHADRDDPNQDITGTTKVKHTNVLKILNIAFSKFPDDNTSVIRAALDLAATWTAGVDREASIRAALGHALDPTLPPPKTQADIRSMTPQELAAHRKRTSEKKTRDMAWAYERSYAILSSETMDHFLCAATECKDHILRREMTVSLGRLLGCIEEEEKVKDLVSSRLQGNAPEDLPRIEEVYNEDEDEKADEEEEISALETLMKRAMITTALLMTKKEIGIWALQFGWKESADELPRLIDSGDPRAMCLASEVLSAASTIEQTRALVTNLLNGGAVAKLLSSDDRDIRSGAASAVTKLGLSDKTAGDAEIMGLLETACALLEDTGEEIKLDKLKTAATSAVERGIEMITYLVANTVVKDELAAGFGSSPTSHHSALEHLVKICEVSNAGESLSGFGLATIFQNMAVTNLQLRKEAFDGKELTMEQYDEIQRMGKTDEEKDLMDSEVDPDTKAACDERIRKMASSNVPRALVALTEGASEHTLEQISVAFYRMASEQSVRGVMIQQGVLTACIKIDKKEDPTETETMKKVIRYARHAIAKVLVTTNPALLTSAQRLGSIKPLIQLIRDLHSTDLQKFEALLALTNVAGSGDDAKSRIASEKGIQSCHFAMFSDHEMVRRAATETLCNMVPHQAMMEHLSDPEHLKLWLAFAADYEKDYECSRAAAGCLAMATQDESVALELTKLKTFQEDISTMLECGRLEIMHRALVLVLNLVAHSGDIKKEAENAGFVAFCAAYAQNFQSNATEGLDFSPEEAQLLPVTADLAKKIVSVANE